MASSYRTELTDSQVVEAGIATYVTATGISDQNKVWAANQWRGHLVRFRGGNNNYAVGVIAGNDSKSFTLEPSLRLTVESSLNTVYEILTMKGGGVEAEAVARLENRLDAILAVLIQVRNGLSIRVGTNLEKS